MGYAQISKYRHVTAHLYFFSKVKIKSWLASNPSVLACQLGAPLFSDGVV